MKHTKLYFENILKSMQSLDLDLIEKSVLLLKELRKTRGRLFLIGVGGSAGNASHAVNDFRKLCNIDAYTPVDNVSEITARTNDEGFENIFDSYLKLCKLNRNDILMIFSVGGGNKKKKSISEYNKSNKVRKNKKSKIISIVGKPDGYAYKNSDIKILIKVKDKKLVTPVSETFQVLIWHLFVSHPKLQINKTKW